LECRALRDDSNSVRERGQAAPPGKAWRPGAEGDSHADRRTAVPMRCREVESLSPDQEQVWSQ